MSVKDVILTVTLMLGAGLVSHFVADTLRAPRMLLLLGTGTLLGPSASDAIDVSADSIAVQLLLTLGVSFILFHGGLQLSTKILGEVAIGLGLLVVPGVILTTLIAGLVAAVAFGVPFSTALLIGAVLAPTDPAILIPLFERIRLRPKVSQTIIAESALNDPTGAVLALALMTVVVSGSASVTKPLQSFVVDLAISTALGLTFGVVLSAAVSSRRAGIWAESSGIAVMAVMSAGYLTIDSAGGSGYLGAFLAGLIVGNMRQLGLAMRSHHESELRTLVAVVSDLMVMFVFIALGANLPWGDIKSHFAPALAVVAALVLVARPLVVLACLLPDRRGHWSREEIVFVAWTRETGVVPAALAGVVVALKIPDANLVVTTVALAIVVTVAVQSTTKGWLAHHLGLLDSLPALTTGPETPPKGAPAR